MSLEFTLKIHDATFLKKFEFMMETLENEPFNDLRSRAKDMQVEFTNKNPKKDDVCNAIAAIELLKMLRISKNAATINPESIDCRTMCPETPIPMPRRRHKSKYDEDRDTEGQNNNVPQTPVPIPSPQQQSKKKRQVVDGGGEEYVQPPATPANAYLYKPSGSLAKQPTQARQSSNRKSPNRSNVGARKIRMSPSRF